MAAEQDLLNTTAGRPAILEGVVSQDPELHNYKQEITRLRRLGDGFGLNLVSICFERASKDSLSLVASFGLPNRFSHWYFGGIYKNLKIQQDESIFSILELVLNTNPPYAFLLDTNSHLENLMVIAHVLGHVDFFRSNCWYAGSKYKAGSDQDMLNKCELHSRSIRDLSQRFGKERVDDIIAAVMTISGTVNVFEVNQKERRKRLLYFLQEQLEKRQPLREKQLELLETRIQQADTQLQLQQGRNERQPTKRLESRQARLEEKRGKLEQQLEKVENRLQSPPEKQRPVTSRKQADDLAPRLESLQASLTSSDGKVRDDLHELRAPVEQLIDTYLHSRIIPMIGQETEYFDVIGRTQIINEGWASFIEFKCLEKFLDPAQWLEFSLHFSKRPPPYLIGFTLFASIFNQGGWDRVLEVRKSFEDIAFVDQYLTQELSEKLDLFMLDKETGEKDFDSRKVKEKIIEEKQHKGQPQVVVEEFDDRSLTITLKHVEDERTLDKKRCELFLKEVHLLWPHEVVLLDSENVYRVNNRGFSLERK